ncbi:MAG: cupin domain-containing protein [Bacteroidales bacterium]|nr:cupin domain-containing protein [Bacteroidales bacterium]
MKDFITPPNHINFLAKNLFGEMGQIINGSIAYVDLNGGGPTTKHSHQHNHLFIVTEGEACVEFEDETVIIHKDEAYLVKGTRLHSVWNNSNGKTVMIGISVK